MEVPARTAPKPAPATARAPPTAAAPPTASAAASPGDRPDGGAGAELRRSRDEPGGDPGPEDAEPEQGEAGEHQPHGLFEVGSWPCSAEVNSVKSWSRCRR